jgi:hypothetical protein
MHFAPNHPPAWLLGAKCTAVMQNVTIVTRGLRFGAFFSTETQLHERQSCPGVAAGPSPGAKYCHGAQADCETGGEALTPY